MEHPSHLSSEQKFQRLIYVGVLSISVPAAEFATWMLTGTAAVLSLFIVNIDSLSKVVSSGNIRWGLVMMTLSILCGGLAKLFGMAIQYGVRLMEEMSAELKSLTSQNSQQQQNLSIDAFINEVASPFLPPYRHIMRNAMMRGKSDFLAGEKRLIKLWCTQMYASYAQVILGALGLIVLICGYK